MKEIAGGFALVPELFPAPTPKPSGFGGYGKAHCLLISKSQHQYLSGIYVLYDYRNQLRFLK